MNNQNQNNSSGKSHTSIETPLDLYAMVTSRIIERLEKGIIPWQQPWDKAGQPRNLVTQKPYRGVNVWLLNSLQHGDNQFLTHKQIKALGGNIKHGEKANPVMFWKSIEQLNPKTNQKEMKPFLRYHNVFNISQCEGIALDKIPAKENRIINPIVECEKIVNEMPNKPEIKNEKHKACYYPEQDYINMPKMETFKDNEKYYATLFHELVHSTGHHSRLKREGITGKNSFGSKGYAKEELTAELGASFLKSRAGLPMEKLDNNAAYIQNWLQVLNDDKKFIVHASSEAQRASDYILNEQVKEKEVEPDEKDLENKQDIVSERAQELEDIRDKGEDQSIEIER